MISGWKSVVVLLILLGSHCARNNPSEPSHKEAWYALKGWIRSTIDEPVRSALLVLEAYSTTTDSSGFFFIDSLLQGSYRLRAVHSEFIEVDTVIQIPRDTVILFRLVPKWLNDFFPLALGNRWVYEYSYSAINPLLSYYTDGIKVWEITGLRSSGSVSEYSLREIFSGKRVRRDIDRESPGSYVYDTLYVVADTSFITLQESTTGRLESVTMTPSGFRTDLIIDIKRYQLPSVGDTLTMKIPHYYTSTQRYVKDVGMTLYDWFAAGNTPRRERYLLREYVLK